MNHKIINFPCSCSDVCAVITTYRPDDEFPERVQRVCSQVGLVIIVDDGELADNVVRLRDWFSRTPEIILHHNPVNVGIAASLNTGVLLAKSKGYHWLLTLDDDSLLLPNAVQRLANGLKNGAWSKPVGVIGMSWTDPGDNIQSQPASNSISFQEKRGIITSGSMFAIDTYDRVGPFREEFFIDSVDYDYCLRAREQGYAIVKLDEIGFEHALGRKNAFHFMGRKVGVESHDAFRVYYGFRNSTVLALEYCRRDVLYSMAVLLAHARKLMRIVICEQDKKLKLKEAFRGVRDGVRRKLGKRIRKP